MYEPIPAWWRLVVVGALLLAPSCANEQRGSDERSGSPSTTAVDRVEGVPLGPAGNGFYQPPDPLPDGEPGQLIWAREIGAPAGASGWRVLYHSRSVDGRDIAVSGVVFAPDADDIEGAPRPVLADAHGTTGLADKCAPSRQGSSAVTASTYLSRGFVVTATDYEGLGTPGRHPYGVGLSAARGVLDSVRAAQQLPATRAGDRVIISGHSQGGGAALIAGELAPTYASELELLGVVAGAPVSELGELATSHTDEFFGYVAMGVAGFHAAYPDLTLDEVVTADGMAGLMDIESLCLEQILVRFRGRAAELFFARDPATVGAWASRLEQNSPGARPAASPVFLFHGTADEQVPLTTSEQVRDRYCRSGDARIDLAVYPGASHMSVLVAAQDDVLRFVDARLDGRAAASSCRPG
ncbi:MAG: lipase family protein [Acidimicrobiales bacterium]